MKLGFVENIKNLYKPAAFGRLCVETIVQTFELIRNGQPPSGGCVLKRL